MPSTAPATPLPGGRAPLYSRLRQALRDRVTSGEWRPGDQIPTIRQLGSLYGVSRITVVQALDALAREGMLLRWQGKGVFVGQPRVDDMHGPLRSFSENALRTGKAPGARVLSLRREAASPHVRERLLLTSDERVVVLERVRLLDGAPVAIQAAYLPEPVARDLTVPLESLYVTLADRYGLLPTSGTETFSVGLLTPEHAQLLEAEIAA